MHRAQFAMHDLACADHFATKSLTDGLVAKADTQKRRAGFGGGFGEGQANARTIWIARSGRQDNARGFQRHRLLHIQRIIAVHRAIRAQFPKVMDKVEGKAVIIVDQKQHLAFLMANSADSGCQRRKAQVYMDRGVKERQDTLGQLSRSEDRTLGRGFLAGIFWGGIVGLGLLFVSSQALDRQELSLPQPEAAAVEVPGGTEFDQAREESDPVLPDADARPEGETSGLASVPEDAVDEAPAFDTTALQVPTPSVGQAGGLSEAPSATEAPEAPATSESTRPDESTSELVVPESPGAAPDAGDAAAQPLAPAADDANDTATSTADAAPSDTDVAVLSGADADAQPGTDTGTAPAVTTDDNAPAAPEAPAIGDEPTLPLATDGNGVVLRAPDIASPTVPESEQADSALKQVEAIGNQAENVETDRLPRIGDATEPEEPEAPTVPEAEEVQPSDATLPTIRRLGNDNSAPEPEAEDVVEAEPEAEAEMAETEGPAIVVFGTEFINPAGNPLMSLVLVQEGTVLEAADIQALPAEIAFAVDAAESGSGGSAAAYRAEGREVVMIPALPEGATPQDVEQALRVNFEMIPEAVAIMDVSGTSFQSDRAAVEQVVDVVADSGHGLITFPRGLNTAHQSASRAGVPAGLIFRRLDGGGETVEQIRRTLDRAAFRARNDEAVILVGTTAPDTLVAIMEWAAGNRARSVTLAPISAALLNE